MKDIYVTPIKRNIGLTRPKPPFLNLAVSGQPENAFFSMESVPTACRDDEAMRIIEVGGEGVFVPLTVSNRVELRVPKGVGEIILASPGWAKIKELAATSGIEIPRHTPYETMLSFVLPGESVAIEIGSEEHKIEPAAFVAAGLRLATRAAMEY